MVWKILVIMSSGTFFFLAFATKRASNSLILSIFFFSYVIVKAFYPLLLEITLILPITRWYLRPVNSDPARHTLSPISITCCGRHVNACSMWLTSTCPRLVGVFLLSIYAQPLCSTRMPTFGALSALTIKQVFIEYISFAVHPDCRVSIYGVIKIQHFTFLLYKEE